MLKGKELDSRHGSLSLERIGKLAEPFQSRALAKRERILASYPEIPEGWRDTYDFFLALSRFRRRDGGFPQPIAVADIAALWGIRPPTEPDLDELLRILSALDETYFETLKRLTPEG